MRHALLALSALAALACNSWKPEPFAPKTDPVARSKALEGLAAQIAQGKTSEDFAVVEGRCSRLEIQARAEDLPLDNDLQFQSICVSGPAKARAQLAINAKGGETMSPHCLPASFALDQLIKRGYEPEAMQKMLAEVHEACGL